MTGTSGSKVDEPRSRVAENVVAWYRSATGE